MSEVDEFSQKKILRVYQQIETRVEYIELNENGHTETKTMVVDSYPRHLPMPEPVELPR